MQNEELYIHNTHQEHVTLATHIQGLLERSRHHTSRVLALGATAAALYGGNAVVNAPVSYANEQCTTEQVGNTVTETCEYTEGSSITVTEEFEDSDGREDEGSRPQHNRNPSRNPSQGRNDSEESTGRATNPNINPKTGVLRYSYNQGDAPWGSMPYRPGTGSGQTYASSGCGPAAFAMVASNLLDKKITPLTIGRQLGKYHTPSGTAHEMPLAAGKRYGLKTAYAGRNMEAVKNTVKNGGLAIALVGPGRFTANGHYIVLSYDKKRNGFHVTDPNSSNSWKEKSVYSAKYLLASGGNNAGNVLKLWTYKQK